MVSVPVGSPPTPRSRSWEVIAETGRWPASIQIDKGRFRDECLICEQFDTLL
jgi:hypothetical protein